jgi:HEAT repeat protein
LNEDAEELRRDALQSLRVHDEQAWTSVPLQVRNSVVAALQGQSFSGANRLSAQKDMAAILGNLGPLTKSAVPQLVALLQNGIHDFVRAAAVAALGNIGKDASPAVGQLIELLATSRPAVSVQIIRTLGNIGCADEEVRSALASRWASPAQDQHSKEQAAIALCKLHIHPDDLLCKLTGALMASQHACDRKAAAAALGWCDAEEIDVVPALLKASLSDMHGEVRETAQLGLDRMGLSREQAIDLCARQLGASVHAEAALTKSGPLAAPVLIEALTSRQTAVRVKAIRALECLGEVAVQAIPALTTAAQDKDMDIRLAALKALWSVSKSADQVVPGLIKLLDTSTVAKLTDSETRRRFLQTVMEALRRIGPSARAAVPALTGMTKDSNRHVRESAALTMQKIVPVVTGKSTV